MGKHSKNKPRDLIYGAGAWYTVGVNTAINNATASDLPGSDTFNAAKKTVADFIDEVKNPIAPGTPVRAMLATEDATAGTSYDADAEKEKVQRSNQIARQASLQIKENLDLEEAKKRNLEEVKRFLKLNNQGIAVLPQGNATEDLRIKNLQTQKKAQRNIAKINGKGRAYQRTWDGYFVASESTRKYLSQKSVDGLEDEINNEWEKFGRSKTSRIKVDSESSGSVVSMPTEKGMMESGAYAGVARPTQKQIESFRGNSSSSIAENGSGGTGNDAGGKVDGDGKTSNKGKWAKRGFIGVGMATLTAAGLAVNSLMINDKGRMNNAQMYGQQPYSQY